MSNWCRTMPILQTEGCAWVRVCEHHCTIGSKAFNVIQRAKTGFQRKTCSKKKNNSNFLWGRVKEWRCQRKENSLESANYLPKNRNGNLPAPSPPYCWWQSNKQLEPPRVNKDGYSWGRIRTKPWHNVAKRNSPLRFITDVQVSPVAFLICQQQMVLVHQANDWHTYIFLRVQLGILLATALLVVESRETICWGSSY